MTPHLTTQVTNNAGDDNTAIYQGIQRWRSNIIQSTSINIDTAMNTITGNNICDASLDNAGDHDTNYDASLDDSGNFDAPRCN